MTDFGSRQQKQESNDARAEFQRGLEELMRGHLDDCMPLASCSFTRDQEEVSSPPGKTDLMTKVIIGKGRESEGRGTMSRLHGIFRSMHTFVQTPRLTRFSLQSPKTVEVEFCDGKVFNLSAEFLRIYSPAANNKIRSAGGERVIHGRRYVGIMSAEPVGNYGVRIIFDDLHDTGIYTWDYFYHLGSNKFTLMRNYVKTLKKHGFSRDPQRK